MKYYNRCIVLSSTSLDLPCLVKHILRDGNALVHQSVAEGLLFVALLSIARQQHIDKLRSVASQLEKVHDESVFPENPWHCRWNVHLTF